jgi:hypothetical protein
VAAPLSGIDGGFGGKQVSAESHDTKAGERQRPGGEKYRTGVKQERIDHRKSSGGARRREALAPFDRTLCQAERSRRKNLLLGSSRGCLIHVLLHACFVLCLHLLQLRLLVRRQQLIELVVNAGLGYGQLSLDLGLLSG